MRINRTLAALLSLVILSVTAACSGATGSSNQGELRIAQEYDLGTLDPQLLTSVGDQQLSQNTFEGLVGYKLGTTEIEPVLATDWTRNSSKTVWTFELRKGVEFHGGYGEMTAEDVIFTFERLLSDELASPNAALMSSVKEVEALSPYRVRFKLQPADPAFLDKLASWYSDIVSRKAVQELGEDFSQKPIGTGSYEFDHWTPQQEIELTPFKQYWGVEPKLNRVVYVPIPDPTTMFNAFESEEVDLIQLTDPDKLKQYESTDGMKISSVPGLITRFFGMKTDSGPFRDPMVREAVTFAIDRDSMIKGLLEGITDKANSILAPGVDHVAPETVDYEYDPQKAKDLLAKAGYPNGFSVTFSVPNIDRFTEPAAVIQEDLKAVGIKVHIRVMEAQSFLAELASKKGLDMFILSRGQEPAPDRVLYTWFHSSQIPENNWARISDPDVDRWLDKAVKSIDEQRREVLFHKVQERVAEGNYYYYLDHEKFLYAMHDQVKGFVNDPRRSLRLDRVYIDEQG